MVHSSETAPEPTAAVFVDVEEEKAEGTGAGVLLLPVC